MATDTKAENSPTFYITEEGETLRDVALRCDLGDDLSRLNRDLELNEVLEKGTVVNCGYVPDGLLEVSAVGVSEYLNSKKTSFDLGLLAVQHELAVVGILLGEFVTGKPNRETKDGVHLWNLVVERAGGTTLDHRALRSLATRNDRFVAVD